MIIQDWLEETTATFKGAGIKTARLDALILLEHSSSVDRSILLSLDEVNVDENSLTKYVKRRVLREPLAYITGHKEFFKNNFAVNSDVLIPRPETEIIVEYIVKKALVAKRLIDIGTGSGAIALSIKEQRPDLLVTASDMSTDALKVARQNARNLSVDVEFFQSDLLKKIEGEFDYIVANLPYIKTEKRTQTEVRFEPDIALYSGPDGLNHYRRLAEQLPSHTSRGLLVIEHDPLQFLALKSIFKRDSGQTRQLSRFVTAFTI